MPDVSAKDSGVENPMRADQAVQCTPGRAGYMIEDALLDSGGNVGKCAVRSEAIVDGI